MEVPELCLEDGTQKIFLNMKSKNGREELVSLLQYMKHTTLNNPDVTVTDWRIVRLDEIVLEVKQSEEWEEVRMNIYEMGIERGIEKGIEIGLEEGIKKGEKIGNIKMLIQLVKQNLLSIPDAAKSADLSEEEFMSQMEEIENSSD